jgi:hypothetical protein
MRAPKQKSGNGSATSDAPLGLTQAILPNPAVGPASASSIKASANGREADRQLAGFFALWVKRDRHAAHENVVLLTELDNARVATMEKICGAVEDHLIGATILARMGFASAAVTAEAKIPKGKKVRSGDLAEILATEYVELHTEFEIPLKRLRHKDDREMSMRGDDIIGLRRSTGSPKVLKGEVKSRASLGAAVVGEACTSLSEHQGRPKSATLGFISSMLRHLDRDTEAARVEDLMQQKLGVQDVEHFVFTMSGNDPSVPLAAHASSPSPGPIRRLVGLRVADHQSFVATVFESVMARYTIQLSNQIAPATTSIAQSGIATFRLDEPVAPEARNDVSSITTDAQTGPASGNAAIG